MTYEKFLKNSKLADYDKTLENYQIWLGIFEYYRVKEKLDTQKCIEEADSSTIAEKKLRNYTQLKQSIIDQLQYGTHSDRHSGESKAGWVIELYEKSDEYDKYNINQILFTEIRSINTDLRIEVLNLLQIKSEILTKHQYKYLLSNYLHLFANQRHSFDSVDRNRGIDFVVLTSNKGERSETLPLVRNFVFDPKFTYSCLPELIYRDTQWLEANIGKIRDIATDESEFDKFMEKYNFT